MTTDTDLLIEMALVEGRNEDRLRPMFGDALYEELRAAAAEAGPPPEVDPARLESLKRQVVILPGIMGSKLSVDRDGRADLIWADPTDILAGRLFELRVQRAHRQTVVPTGVFVTAYLLMRLRLRRAGYHAWFQPYDWRFLPEDAGRKLHAKLKRQGASDVALVAHSMGGLVARSVAGLDPDSEIVSQVITAGTPNYGSYSPVEVMRLTSGMLQTLDKGDLVHSAEEIVEECIRHLPGLAQMLPHPDKRPGEAYFTTDGWPERGGVRPLKRVLDTAKEAADALPPPDMRFRQIIGSGIPTIVGATGNAGGIAFHRSAAGDGTVPRDLAEMDGPHGAVPRWYVEGKHGGLMNRRDVFRAVRDLLEDGDTDELSKSPALGTESVDRIIEEAAQAQAQAAGLDPAQPLESALLDGLAAASGGDSFGGARTAAAPDGEPVMGYVRETMDRAAALWESLEPERVAAGKAALENAPTKAETPERLERYIERLAQHVEALPAAAIEAAPDLVQEVRARSRRAPHPVAQEIVPGDVTLERVIGETEDFLSVFFVKRAQVAMRSVGRIVSVPGGRGFGTGFLIAPGVLITNHHVLGTAGAAFGAAVEFNYELDVSRTAAPSEIFDLEPDRLFFADRKLDYAVVAVRPRSRQGADLAAFGHLPLAAIQGKVRTGAPVNIVQHPGGERKQVVFRKSTLIALPAEMGKPEEFDHVALYSGDTRPGSSGSPVFSDLWEVVALHHAGVPDRTEDGAYKTYDGTPWNHVLDPQGDTIRWVANEGIRISRIVRHLRQNREEGRLDGSQADTLVGEVLRRGEEAGRDAFGLKTSQQESAPSAPVVDIEDGSEIDIMSETIVPVTLRLRVEVEGTAPVLERRGDDLSDRGGYDPDFLSRPVPLPRPLAGTEGRALTLPGGGTELRYANYSVLMHATRRLALVSIGNVDPGAKKRTERGGFRADPRLGAEAQATNTHYRNNPIDRGHLFKRANAAWGADEAAAQRADDDTFYWPNIAPQHEIFNQAGRDAEASLWGDIENHIAAQAGDRRWSVANGPLFAADDPELWGLEVPQAYFKLVLTETEAEGLCAHAFLLGQEGLLRSLVDERLDPGRFGVFQLRVAELEAKVALDFGRTARAVDAMARPAALERLGPGMSYRRITGLGDLV